MQVPFPSGAIKAMRRGSWPLRLSVGAIALSTVALAACGAPKAETSTKAASTDTYTIAANFELSGATAAFGAPALEGVRFYVDQVNANGGINGKKLVLKSVDNQSNASTGTTQMRSLVADPNVLAVVGPQAPDTARAMAKLAGPADLTMVSFLQSVTDQEFNDSPSFFRMGYSSDRSMLAGLKVLHQNGAKKIALIYAEDTGGRAGADTVSRLAASANLSITGKVSYPADVTDPTSQVLRAKSSGPDAYVVWDSNSVSRLAQVVRSMRANGINAPVYTPEAASLTDFLKAAGKVNDVYFWAAFATAHPLTPTQADFVKAWNAKNGQDPTDFNSAGYAMAQLVGGAITQAAKDGHTVDREAVRKAMEGLTSFDTVYGSASYSATNHGVPFENVTVLKYVDGVAEQVTNLK